uniref:Uncharacterized protein n=1 Tax=Timema monikensis TaxID=170555 RepID=A0A7R9E5M2_9NEOP|nr:unnamed protein product [Timema monikensis]
MDTERKVLGYDGVNSFVEVYHEDWKDDVIQINFSMIPASVAKLANALVVLSSTAEDGEIEQQTNKKRPKQIYFLSNQRSFYTVRKHSGIPEDKLDSWRAYRFVFHRSDDAQGNIQKSCHIVLPHNHHLKNGLWARIFLQRPASNLYPGGHLAGTLMMFSCCSLLSGTATTLRRNVLRIMTTIIPFNNVRRCVVMLDTGLEC